MLAGERSPNALQPCRDVIDVVLARQLRADGVSWREIGGILALVDDRPVAYQATSVATAVRLARGRRR